MYNTLIDFKQKKSFYQTRMYIFLPRFFICAEGTTEQVNAKFLKWKYNFQQQHTLIWRTRVKSCPWQLAVKKN